MAHSFRSPLKSLYLISSDEVLLTQETVDALRATARAEGYTEREVLNVEGRFDWGQLTESMQSLSLFGERKIVELRIPSGKPGKDGSDALKYLTAQLSDDTLIIITLPKLDKTSKNSVWFKALSSAGELIEIQNVALAHLPRWISERLKVNGQTASPSALQLMSQQFEGNLIAAHQEIQKLALLFPAGQLSDEQVQQSVFNVARYDVFGLSEGLLAGDTARVCRMIEGLKAEGESIVLVLWALTEDVRTLTALKHDVQQGESLGSAMRNRRVWGAREKLMPQAIQALSLAFLKNALQRTHELDRLAKGLTKGDVWDATLQLASQIALRIQQKNAPK
ncbi:DNA polymerase III subunit delta [Hydromonas duriensis]|uniref:DNA polymerase III subunit delta n=1 Tax=Hydromonas duriensis TaxID=1527608 RepID=A0A4R6Y852_9BURK|nr:DNA polymerase III subunit delta [Hydromonas duriensis]TDR31556.1 DNA polymerase III delta subunit [Hydromonas duriensis]